MIVKIAGASGSGKTSLMRAFMKFVAAKYKVEFHAVEEVNSDGTATWKEQWQESFGSMANAPFKRVDVLGRYVPGVATGGMDCIGSKDVRYRMIERHTKATKVLCLFEGLIVGKTYGAIGALSEATRKAPWLYVFMDTPFDVCVWRVQQRRAAAGNTSAFDPEKHLRSDWRSCFVGTRDRATEAGFPVYIVRHRETPEVQARALWKAILAVKQ